MKIYMSIDNAITLSKVNKNFWEAVETPLIILGVIILTFIIFWIVSTIDKRINGGNYIDGDDAVISMIMPLCAIALFDLIAIFIIFMSSTTPTFNDSMNDIAPKYNMSIVNSDPNSKLYYLEENSTHKYYKNCFTKITKVNETTEKAQLICDTSEGVREISPKK